MQVISSPEINKLLRRYLSPILRDHGFQKVEARKAWGWHGHAVRVFEVRAVGAYFSYVTGWPPMSITAWTGMYYDFIVPYRAGPPKIDKCGRIIPREWECHLRGTVHPTLNQAAYQSRLPNPAERMRNDIWWIEPNGENLADVIENLTLRVIEEALPWFERLTDERKAFEQIEQEHECYNKYWRALYFAQRLGYSEKQKRFSELLQQEQARLDSLFQTPKRKRTRRHQASP